MSLMHSGQAPRIRRLSINRNDVIIVNNQPCGQVFVKSTSEGVFWVGEYTWPPRDGRKFKAMEKTKTKLLTSLRLAGILKPRLVVDNTNTKG